MSRILVTGRNGFIGRPLAEALKKDHKIISIVRKKDSTLDYKDEETVVSDLRQVSLEDVKDRQIELILHLAAKLRGSGGVVEHNNVEASKRIFDIARQLNIPVLFLSSLNSFFYEDLGEYARSKRICEALLSESSSRYLIVRVPLVMGVGSPSEKSIRQVYRKLGFLPLLGRGLGQTQPIPVSSLIQILAEKVNRHKFEGGAINVIGQQAYTYRKILENIFKGQNIRFIRFPYKLSLMLVRFLEKMNISLPLSSEEIKSINIDKLFNPQKHGQAMIVDNTV